MAVVYGFTGRRGQTGTGFCMVFLLRGSITDTGLFDWQDFDNILDIYKSAEPALWGVTQIKKKGLRDMGASLGPEAAHHLALGSETLPLRMDRACRNAKLLTEFCCQPNKIKNVYYLFRRK